MNKYEAYQLTQATRALQVRLRTRDEFARKRGSNQNYPAAMAEGIYSQEELQLIRQFAGSYWDYQLPGDTRHDGYPWTWCRDCLTTDPPTE